MKIYLVIPMIHMTRPWLREAKVYSSFEAADQATETDPYFTQYEKLAMWEYVVEGSDADARPSRWDWLQEPWLSKKGMPKRTIGLPTNSDLVYIKETGCAGEPRLLYSR